MRVESIQSVRLRLLEGLRANWRHNGYSSISATRQQQGDYSLIGRDCLIGIRYGSIITSSVLLSFHMVALPSDYMSGQELDGPVGKVLYI